MLLLLLLLLLLLWPVLLQVLLCMLHPHSPMLVALFPQTTSPLLQSSRTWKRVNIVACQAHTSAAPMLAPVLPCTHCWLRPLPHSPH
jgi:hypothetical protein